jgi:3-oxoacyl-[acyl-carrier-protein] synthase-3
MTGLRIPEAAAGARILAFGDYRPARIVTNEELSRTVDTNDEWIRTRVGIQERRIAGDDEGIVELGLHAGGKAW